MSPSRRDHGALIVGGEPRIDFLPIETKQRKANRRRRRSYVALVIAVIAVCAVAVALTTKRTADAQDALKVEQARTSQILADQREFAEVLTVTGDTTAVTSARLIGSANDIMWKDVMLDVFATLEAPLPYAFVIDSQSALETPLMVEHSLQKPAVASVFLTFGVPNFTVADAVIANLPSMPAFADATAVTTTWDIQKGFYVMNIVLRINVDALDRRYFETPPATDDASEETTDDASEEDGN